MIPAKGLNSKLDEPVSNCADKLVIVWRNVFALVSLHILALYGLYLWIIARQCYISTVVFHVLWAMFASFGITAGAHRLWAHRAYKANQPLRIFYAVLMSMIFANDIFTWARDHRVHHKFSETNADPHNAKRGLFFAHIGWLLVRKHPDVLRKGATISVKDMENDKIVMFHKKYYAILMPLGTFIIPTLIPLFFWNQQYAFHFCILRYIINIHIVWSLNSVAHLYGYKPYNKNIYASENAILMCITIGEGFHNYHHVFPWDYKAAELGNDKRNLTTVLLNCFAALGWATHMKSVSDKLIMKQALNHGDGTWLKQYSNNLPTSKMYDMRGSRKNDVMCWGWDDPDISTDDKMNTNIC